MLTSSSLDRKPPGMNGMEAGLRTALPAILDVLGEERRMGIAFETKRLSSSPSVGWNGLTCLDSYE
jgi:hypothetical protein